MSIISTNRKAGLDLSWQAALVFVLGTAALMLPDLAVAADTPIGNIFCIVAGWFTGNTGKGLATIAITIIGVGALLGKVSWGMALIVGVGIALVFGAAGVVEAFNIPGVQTGCNTNAGGFGGTPSP